MHLKNDVICSNGTIIKQSLLINKSSTKFDNQVIRVSIFVTPFYSFIHLKKKVN